MKTELTEQLRGRGMVPITIMTKTLCDAAAKEIEHLNDALQKIVETAPANGEDVSYLIAKQALASDEQSDE